MNLKTRKIIARETLFLVSVIFLSTVGFYTWNQIQIFRYNQKLEERVKINQIISKQIIINRIYSIYNDNRFGFKLWNRVYTDKDYTKSFRKFISQYALDEPKQELLFYKMIEINGDPFWLVAENLNKPKYYNFSDLELTIFSTKNLKSFKDYYFNKTLFVTNGKPTDIVNYQKLLLNYLSQKTKNDRNIEYHIDLLLQFNDFKVRDDLTKLLKANYLEGDELDSKKYNSELLKINEVLNKLDKEIVADEDLKYKMSNVFLYFFLLTFGLRYIFYVIKWSVKTLKS